MARTNQFYLMRISKLGELTTNGILEAISNPPSFEVGKYAWTIDKPLVGEIESDGYRTTYCGGHLIKYDREAIVEVVDEKKKKVVLKPEPNLQMASSQFSYLPEYQTILFRKVWNHIHEDTFERRFQRLIRLYHSDFFVDLDLNDIASGEKFHIELGKLTSVSSIRAKVHPPNPLYHRYWKGLSDYLRNRNAQTIEVIEHAAREGQLESSITTAAQSIQNTRPADSVVDAAVMMAADGYGAATVTGKSKKSTVTISTSDSSTILHLPSDVSVSDLSLQALRISENIQTERGLEH